MLRSANYIMNRCPTWALHYKSTPFEKLFGTKPNLSDLRIIGCIAYLHILAKSRSKLDAKSLKAILVGYDKVTKGYHHFSPNNKKYSLVKMFVLMRAHSGCSTLILAFVPSILDFRDIL